MKTTVINFSKDERNTLITVNSTDEYLLTIVERMNPKLSNGLRPSSTRVFGFLIMSNFRSDSGCESFVEAFKLSIKAFASKSLGPIEFQEIIEEIKSYPAPVYRGGHDFAWVIPTEKAEKYLKNQCINKEEQTNA